MRAVVYISQTLDDKLNEVRQDRLNQFLNKEKLEVEHIYYDVIGIDFNNNRLGLKKLLTDLKNKAISADAFVTISVNDMGNNDDFIEIIGEINQHIENIYFAELEGA